MKTVLSMAAAAAALALAACSQGEKPASGAAGVKLYTFDCGRIQMNDLTLFTQGNEYDGRTNYGSVMCFLVRHPDGDLLWDAGLPAAIHDAGEEGVTSGPFTMEMPKTIEMQLAEIGLTVDDVDYFTPSHSHFDHIGDAGRFAGATFLIDKDERAHMFRDEARADEQTFPLYSDLEGAETVEFDGDHDVFGDGSVTILDMPGHTPGHKSLLVKLENEGPVLLSGDLYHLQESREKRLVPKFNTNVEDTLASMDRFEEIAAETGARVVIQHVMADYEALPRLPDYLD
ncbi:N-acyl homoserine lactonase family protein [Hyphococcus sp.]|uniref:N-acyl homoserine lactonase family protein n=1 Tax=Hyphococcus sp. TaxID=2038636 RepID=UPI003D0F1489